MSKEHDTRLLLELFEQIIDQAKALPPNNVLELQVKLRIGPNGLVFDHFSDSKPRSPSPSEMLGPPIVEEDWNIMFKALEGQVSAGHSKKLLTDFKSNDNKLRFISLIDRHPARSYLNKIFTHFVLPYRVVLSSRGSRFNDRDSEAHYYIGRLY